MDPEQQKLVQDIDKQINWYTSHYWRWALCHFCLLGILIISATFAPILLVGASSSTEKAASSVMTATTPPLSGTGPPGIATSSQPLPKIDLTTFGVPTKTVAWLTLILTLLGFASEAVRRYARCSETYARYYTTKFALETLKDNFQSVIGSQSDDQHRKLVTARARRLFSSITIKETQETFASMARTFGLNEKFEVMDTSLDETGGFKP